MELFKEFVYQDKTVNWWQLHRYLSWYAILSLSGTEIQIFKSVKEYIVYFLLVRGEEEATFVGINAETGEIKQANIYNV